MALGQLGLKTSLAELILGLKGLNRLDRGLRGFGEGEGRRLHIWEFTPVFTPVFQQVHQNPLFFRLSFPSFHSSSSSPSPPPPPPYRRNIERQVLLEILLITFRASVLLTWLMPNPLWLRVRAGNRQPAASVSAALLSAAASSTLVPVSGGSSGAGQRKR